MRSLTDFLRMSFHAKYSNYDNNNNNKNRPIVIYDYEPRFT